MTLRHEHWQFDDFEEFLELCRRPATKAEKRQFGSKTYWTEESLKGALRLVTEGWAEGRDMMGERIEQLTPYVQAAHFDRGDEFAAAGYAPNVPAFCAGNPAHMYTQGTEYVARSPLIRILLNIARPADIEITMNRGAALASVIHYLESAGTRVQLDVCDASQGSNRRGPSLFECYVPIKHPTQYVEPDRLAYAIGNPGMLTDLIFRVIRYTANSTPDGEAVFANSYGGINDTTPDADQVYIPSTMRGCDTPEGALRHVLDCVSRKLPEAEQRLIQKEWTDVLTDTRFRR